MPIYYPACSVSIGIRFDDTFSVSKGTRANKGSVENLLADQPQNDPFPFSKKETEPLLVGPPSDELSWALNLVPTKANVKLDGYRKAATFSVSVPWHVLPINPLLIRAGQCRVFFGTVPKDSFAKGISSGKPGQIRESQLRVYDDAGMPDLKKLACWGLFDSHSIKFGGENGLVTIEGRDLRGVLLDYHVERDLIKGLNLDQPIHYVVRDILASQPLFKGVEIVVQAVDWPNPDKIPHPCAAGNVTRVNQGVAGKSAKAHPPAPNSKLTYWDLIVQYCYLVGAIPYFHGRDIFIRPVASLYDMRNIDKIADGFNPAIRSPFKDNQPRIGFGAGAPFVQRKLIYGKNLDEMEFKRNFHGNHKPKIIEVVCLNTSSDKPGKQKLLSVKWPKDIAKKLDDSKRKSAGKGGKGTSVAPGGGGSETEKEVIPVYGLTTISQLEDVARAIFESRAHREVEVQFKVKELASYLGLANYEHNDDPDMVYLRPGDGASFAIDATSIGTRKRGEADVVSELNRLESLSFDDAVMEIARRFHGDMNLARAIVATARNAVVETQLTYRVFEVELSWDNPYLKINGKAHNYIEAAYGSTADDGGGTGKKKPPLRKLEKLTVDKSIIGDPLFDKLGS